MGEGGEGKERRGGRRGEGGRREEGGREGGRREEGEGKEERGVNFRLDVRTISNTWPSANLIG